MVFGEVDPLIVNKTRELKTANSNGRPEFADLINLEFARPGIYQQLKLSCTPNFSSFKKLMRRRLGLLLFFLKRRLGSNPK